MHPVYSFLVAFDVCVFARFHLLMVMCAWYAAFIWKADPQGDFVVYAIHDMMHCSTHNFQVFLSLNMQHIVTRRVVAYFHGKMRTYGYMYILHAVALMCAGQEGLDRSVWNRVVLAKVLNGQRMCTHKCLRWMVKLKHIRVHI
jgi:hypothetical protein